MDTHQIDAPQPQLDFDSLFTPLGPVVNSIGVPLTSTFVHTRDKRRQFHTYRKTLIGNPKTSSCSLIPQSTPSGLNSGGETSLNGVSKILLEAKDNEVDKIGGKTMFAVFSTAKPIIALLCLVITQTKPDDPPDDPPPFTLETKVFSYMNQLYGTKKPIFKQNYGIDPTIEDLLLNRTLLPLFNRVVFLPDGKCALVDDERVIERIENIIYQRSRVEREASPNVKASYRYNNANYILLVLLLQKLYDKPISQILRERLFKPLAMNNTTMDPKELDEMVLASSGNIAMGQRMSGDLKTCFAAPKGDYMNSTAGRVVAGMWSCVDDLAKLYIDICKAIHYPGEQNPDAFFSRKVATSFLKRVFNIGDAGSQQPGVAFAGLIYKLNSPDQGEESLNQVLRQETNSTRTHNHGDTATGSSTDVFYKGGTGDASLGTIYFEPRSWTIAIVLSNAVGPVDITEPVARYLLQASIRLGVNVKIDTVRTKLEEEVADLKSHSCALWQRLEKEDKAPLASPDQVQPFVGVYRHREHDLELEITNNAEAIFRWNKQVLTTMKVGTSASGLRLQSTQQGLFVDRLTFYRDVALFIYKKGHETVLAVGEDQHKDEYFKR